MGACRNIDLGCWTLEEAFHRCKNVDLWQAYERSCEALEKRRAEINAPGGFPSPFRLATDRFRGDAKAALKNWRFHQLKELRADQTKNRRRLNQHFAELLISQKLIAYCTDGSPSGQHTAIHPGIWKEHFSDFDFLKPRRFIRYRAGKAVHELHQLKVLPAMRSPDALSLLDGLSVVDVFQKYILGDPEFQNALQRLKQEGTHGSFWAQLFQGHFTGEGRALWPASIGRNTDNWTWRGIPKLYHDGPEETRHPFVSAWDECSQSTQTFQDRLTIFLEHLQLGRLVAHGTATDSGQYLAIQKAWFQRKDTSIDFECGDVVQWISENNERVVFNSLMLALPSPDQDYAAGANAQVQAIVGDSAAALKSAGGASFNQENVHLIDVVETALRHLARENHFDGDALVQHFSNRGAKTAWARAVAQTHGSKSVDSVRRYLGDFLKDSKWLGSIGS